MKRLILTITITMFVALSTPSFGEEKSIDDQMELICVKLENIQLKEALIARQFKDLRLLKAQLVAQLKELQLQKDEKKKLEDVDIEEE